MDGIGVDSLGIDRVGVDSVWIAVGRSEVTSTSFTNEAMPPLR